MFKEIETSIKCAACGRKIKLKGIPSNEKCLCKTCQEKFKINIANESYNYGSYNNY